MKLTEKKSTKGSNLINRKEKLEILIFYDEKIAPTFHLEMSGVPNGFFLNYDYYITYWQSSPQCYGSHNGIGRIKKKKKRLINTVMAINHNNMHPRQA